MVTVHSEITDRAPGENNQILKAEQLEPLAVTLKVASKITGLGLTTLWKLAKENKIEIVRVGGRTLATYRGLKALLLRKPNCSLQPRRRGRPRKRPATQAQS